MIIYSAWSAKTCDLAYFTKKESAINEAVQYVKDCCNTYMLGEATANTMIAQLKVEGRAYYFDEALQTNIDIASVDVVEVSEE